MGIISEYVDIRVNAFTCNYYSRLGYEIPKRPNKKGELKIDTSQTFKVRVSDLPPKSHAVINVQCDCCNKKLEVIYENYNTVIKKHGKYLCYKCANREYNSGENNSNWNSNLIDEERQFGRSCIEYYEFVKNVLYRDNYTCQCCGKKINNPHVHHKNGYQWFIEGRYDVKNGVTLCPDCHNNFHVEYGRGNNTEEQYNEWISKSKQLLLQHNLGFLPPCRKVYCYEENKIYDSVKMAQVINNYKSRSNIYQVCNHKKKYYTAYGKHWFWHDEYINMTEEEILFYVNK